MGLEGDANLVRRKRRGGIGDRLWSAFVCGVDHIRNLAGDRQTMGRRFILGPGCRRHPDKADRHQAGQKGGRIHNRAHDLSPFDTGC